MISRYHFSAFLIDKQKGAFSNSQQTALVFILAVLQHWYVRQFDAEMLNKQGFILFWVDASNVLSATKAIDTYTLLKTLSRRLSKFRDYFRSIELARS